MSRFIELDLVKAPLGAFRGVLDKDIHFKKFVSDLIGFFKVLFLSGCISLVNKSFNFVC